MSETILDIARRGSDKAGNLEVPKPKTPLSEFERAAQIVSRFPKTKVPGVEGSDGCKHDVAAHVLSLANDRVFGLVHGISAYEPIVFASQGNRHVMGILSPNFDSSGTSQLPSIKVIPLQTPYPLIRQGSNLLPDARMATMLAGAAHAEGPGVGGHDRPPQDDYEHRVAFVGAVSLGKGTILENGAHPQHGVREQSSVATGMSDGSLGNVFAAGSKMGDFTGYGMPMVFEPGRTGANDAVYIPEGFLDSEQAFGASYPDAARIVYGAGLQIVTNRLGAENVGKQLNTIAAATA